MSNDLGWALSPPPHHCPSEVMLWLKILTYVEWSNRK